VVLQNLFQSAYLSFQIIYSTIRFITPEELEWYLEDCIALKKEFPHLIAGIYLIYSRYTMEAH